MKREDRRAILQACGAKRKSRRLQILASLMLNGNTTISVAEKNDIRPQSISKVICGRMHTPRILDMLRAAGAKEQDLFDPAKMLANKCQYTTKELSLLLNKPVRTILRWAECENWEGERRMAKGGGMVWLTHSIPEHRRMALAIAEQVRGNA